MITVSNIQRLNYITTCIHKYLLPKSEKNISCTTGTTSPSLKSHESNSDHVQMSKMIIHYSCIF